MIRSGWITQGPEVAAFEHEFAAFTGADARRRRVNCTTALHLALLGVGVGPGDEVITVSHSYIATANAIAYCGATPVFVDVERDTQNMDAALIEARHHGADEGDPLPSTRSACRATSSAIAAVADRHGLPVVEDAACAVGSEIASAARGSGSVDRTASSRASRSTPAR